MKLIDAAGRWAEWLVVPLLALGTFFNYQHEAYVSAIVSAACTGFVLAINLASWMLHRRAREHQQEMDALASLVQARQEQAYLWSTYGRDGLSRMLNGSGLPAARCRWCGRTTANPQDIYQRYCGCCGGAFMPKGCPHRPLDFEPDRPAW